MSLETTTLDGETRYGRRDGAGPTIQQTHGGWPCVFGGCSRQRWSIGAHTHIDVLPRVASAADVP
jgi:hypothetical protein